MRRDKPYTFLVLTSLVLALSLAIGPGNAQLVPDFTMSANPNSQIVVGGGQSNITLTSINGFAGTVTLTLPPLCLSLFCPTWSISPTSVSLSAGGAAKAILSFSAPLTGNYVVRVTGTSGSISHFVDVFFTVISQTDFAITAAPTSLSITKGSAGSSSITLTSPGIAGATVSLTATVSPLKHDGLLATLSPALVTLPAGGKTTSTLTVSASKNTPPTLYSVDVTATSGLISHSVTIMVVVTS